MTNLAIFNQDQEVTMSHVQIAELLDKRNDTVKVTMDRLKDKGLISVTSMTERLKNTTRTVYHVNERDSYVVVAQLSPEFTAKLVDFWMDYKNKKESNPFNLPTNYIEALEHLLESKKENLVLVEELKEKDEHIKVVERRPVLRQQPDCNETSITKIRQKYSKQNGLSAEVVDFVVFEFDGGIKSSGSCLIQNEKANGGSYKQYLVKDVTKAFNKFLHQCIIADLGFTKLAHTQYKYGKPFKGFKPFDANEMGSLL